MDDSCPGKTFIFLIYFPIIFLVESFKEIQDSICVAQRKKDHSEERVVLFLKMAQGVPFTMDLVNNVKNCIRKYLTARHVPGLILPCEDIPVSFTNQSTFKTQIVPVLRFLYSFAFILQNNVSISCN